MSARGAAVLGEEQLAALHERLTRARRGMVAIRAGALTATGWVALGSGVVATSRRAIGYPTEVTLEPDERRTIVARVVAADVARDVALLAPLESLGLPALPVRAVPEPRLGERATVLSLLPGQGLRVVVGQVCQLRRGEGVAPSFELDAAAAPGSPALDGEGRVLGVVMSSSGSGRCEALPVGAMQALLASVDRPLGELRDRAAVYRCPSCDEPFDVESDRCLSCGRPLPHAYAPCAVRARGERLVREALASLGMMANRVRMGPRAWRIVQRPFSTAEATQVEIELDEEGRVLTLRVPVVGLPAANHEPFYRFLLTMNDQTTGELRVSVAGDLVSVSCVVPIEGSSDHDAAVLVDEIVRVADEYRRTLADTFEAVPRYEVGG